MRAGMQCSARRVALHHTPPPPSSPCQVATCGNLTRPLDPTKKNILIIGDSISMTPPYTPGGYGHALEALLSARGYAVQHAGGDFSGGQAGDSHMGVLCTNESYSGSYFAGLPAGAQFDLIHFNYGTRMRLRRLSHGCKRACPLHIPASLPRRPQASTISPITGQLCRPRRCRSTATTCAPSTIFSRSTPSW